MEYYTPEIKQIARERAAQLKARADAFKGSWTICSKTGVSMRLTTRVHGVNRQYDGYQFVNPYEDGIDFFEKDIDDTQAMLDTIANDMERILDREIPL